MRKQMASIPVHIEDAVTQRFGDARRATESGPDTKKISVIKTVVNEALAKGRQSAAFYLVSE